jgi:hypothetical protein
MQANGEKANPTTKPVYTLPYPIAADACNRVVALMFDASSSTGTLLYTGTDVMEFAEGSGMSQDARGKVQRIVTINHRTGDCYSPKTVV